MTVGGGFAGFTGTLLSLSTSFGQGTLKSVLILAFAGLYVFVAACGLLFVRDPLRTRPVMAGLALQIPWTSSSVILYKFVAGVQFALGLFGGEPGGAGINIKWEGFVGSTWQLSITVGPHARCRSEFRGSCNASPLAQIT